MRFPRYCSVPYIFVDGFHCLPGGFCSLILWSLTAIVLTPMAGLYLFRKRVARDVTNQLTAAISSVGPQQLPAQWDSLPESMRRYLRFAVDADAPATHTVRLEHGEPWSGTIPKRRSGKQVVEGGEKLGRRGGITLKLQDALQDLHKNLHSVTVPRINACDCKELHAHA